MSCHVMPCQQHDAAYRHVAQHLSGCGCLPLSYNTPQTPQRYNTTGCSPDCTMNTAITHTITANIGMALSLMRLPVGYSERFIPRCFPMITVLGYKVLWGEWHTVQWMGLLHSPRTDEGRLIQDNLGCYLWNDKQQERRVVLWCTVLCNAQSGQNPLKPLIKWGLRRHQFEAHLVQVYNPLKPLDEAAFDHWLVKKSNEIAVFLFWP